MSVNFLILRDDSRTETENRADYTIMELRSHFTVKLTNKNRLNKMCRNFWTFMSTKLKKKLLFLDFFLKQWKINFREKKYVIF